MSTVLTVAQTAVVLTVAAVSPNAVALRAIELDATTVAAPNDLDVIAYHAASGKYKAIDIDVVVQEAVDDRVAALIQDSATGGLTWVYDDGAGTLTPTLQIINADVAVGAAIVASKVAAGTFGAGTYSFAGSTISALDALTVTNNATVGGTLGVTGVLTASGGVDGVLGGVTPAAATVTTLNATGGGALTGTWSDLGVVTLVDINGGTIGGVTLDGTISGTPTWASDQAITLSTAAQPNVTSLGTLTALQVDNLLLDGNTLSSTAGVDLLITPLDGQQIVLDGTIIIDAGVVTGATSITSTAFVGALTGNADTATLAADATTLETPRTINGVAFDGSINITVTAAAGTLTGTTLNATVVSSGLTSLGTIGSLVATTADINGGTIDGAIIGGASAADGTFAALSAGSLAITGTLTTQHVVPATPNTYDLGATGNAYAKLWVNSLEANGVGTIVGDWRFTTGTIGFATSASIEDNALLKFGNEPDYWMKYNTSGTAFEFISTTGGGGSTDGTIFSVQDGSDAIVFAGAVTGAAGTFTDLTSTGNTTLGNASGDSLTYHPAAWTLTNAVTITGTWTDLGIVSTADINGGTIDATAIGGGTPAAGAFTTLDASGAVVFAGSFVITGNDASINGLTAGKGLTADATNTFFGVSSGGAVTTADHSTGIGNSTLALVTEGLGATAIGSRALESLTTGDHHTAIGRSALSAVVTGAGSTACGYLALFQSTGERNVAIGHSAARYATTQDDEFFLNNQDRTNRSGDLAGSLIYGTFHATPASQTLTFNAAVTVAQTLTTTGILTVSDETDTTGVGTGALRVAGGADFAKKVLVGTTLTVTTSLLSAFPNTVSGTGLMVTTNDGSVQEIMRDSSSARFKTDIVDAKIDPAKVLGIMAKEYGRPGAKGRTMGFIVEDFHEAGFGDILAYDAEGPAGFLDFGRGITALHHVVLQSHEERIAELEAEIETLKAA